MAFKPLAIGIDDFEKLMTDGYYYVDKTLMIKELLDKRGEVNLFTRPRRFGKTLNMSMLQCFFENTGDAESNMKRADLFRDLHIMHAGSLYTKHMNQYPVITFTLKSAKQATWELAFGCLKEELAREYKRHSQAMMYLELESEHRRYRDIMNQQGSLQDYLTSIRFLSECLQKQYQKPVIILIDEYDVPLENAYFAGYYKEMVQFIRSVFESSLKTNPHLEFAVLTGCLRITKESIFTGLNNLKMISILNASYDEYFGFTQAEVNQMLHDYGLSGKSEEVTEWYDGYRFGNTEVYNPWSVTNYLEAHSMNPMAFPAPYWANTSSNSIVRKLIERASASVKAELEDLIAGKFIEKPVHEDITYDSIYDSEDNLWNFLFFTGYLKQVSCRMEMETLYVKMAIPNMEIRYIYRTNISNWFRDKVKVSNLSVLYQALMSGDAETVRQELAMLLQRSISYMDNQEAFYHGFLLGIFENMKDYRVKSNREAGDGRLDIQVLPPDVAQTPVILELKVAKAFKELDAACDDALQQIEDRQYYEPLPEEGYHDVWCYGVAFFRKQCRVKLVRRCLE